MAGKPSQPFSIHVSCANMDRSSVFSPMFDCGMLYNNRLFDNRLVSQRGRPFLDFTLSLFSIFLNRPYPYTSETIYSGVFSTRTTLLNHCFRLPPRATSHLLLHLYSLHQSSLPALIIAFLGVFMHPPTHCSHSFSPCQFPLVVLASLHVR